MSTSTNDLLKSPDSDTNEQLSTNINIPNSNQHKNSFDTAVLKVSNQGNKNQDFSNQFLDYLKADGKYDIKTENSYVRNDVSEDSMSGSRLRQAIIESKPQSTQPKSIQERTKEINKMREEKLNKLRDQKIKDENGISNTNVKHSKNRNDIFSEDDIYIRSIKYRNEVNSRIEEQKVTQEKQENEQLSFHPQISQRSKKMAQNSEKRPKDLSTLRSKINQKLNTSSSNRDLLKETKPVKEKNTPLNKSNSNRNLNALQSNSSNLSLNLSKVNSNSKNFINENMKTIKGLASEVKTARDEKIKETEKENNIKTVNRKMVKQQFIEEFNQILLELQSTREGNTVEYEINFGNTHMDLDTSFTNKVITYNEFKSILHNLKLITGSETDQDEKEMMIELQEEIKEVKDEDLNQVLVETLCEVLIIILGLNTSTNYSSPLLNKFQKEKIKYEPFKENRRRMLIRERNIEKQTQTPVLNKNSNEILARNGRSINNDERIEDRLMKQGSLQEEKRKIQKQMQEEQEKKEEEEILGYKMKLNTNPEVLKTYTQIKYSPRKINNFILNESELRNDKGRKENGKTKSKGYDNSLNNGYDISVSISHKNEKPSVLSNVTNTKNADSKSNQPNLSIRKNKAILEQVNKMNKVRKDKQLMEECKQKGDFIGKFLRADLKKHDASINQEEFTLTNIQSSVENSVEDRKEKSPKQRLNIDLSRLSTNVRRKVEKNQVDINRNNTHRKKTDRALKISVPTDIINICDLDYVDMQLKEYRNNFNHDEKIVLKLV